MDTLSSGEVETAAQAAKRGMALLEASGTRAAGGASLLKSQGFSFLGMLSGITSFISTAIFIVPTVLSRVTTWQWPTKLPLIGPALRRIFPTAGKFAALSNVTVGQLAPETAQAFAHAAEAFPSAKTAINWTSSAFQKTHNGIAQFAQKTLGRNNLGAKALHSLSGASVNNAVLGGTMVVGEGANIAISSARRLRVLRQMQADITGKPAPSTWAILMGHKLHPLVLQARKELMGKKALLGTLVQVGGMVGNMVMMFRGSGLLKQLGFGAGMGLVGHVLTSADTAIAAYDNLHQSFAHTGSASLGDYAGVIGGFAKHADDQMVRTFARQCYEEKVPPAELLRRIGVFQKSLSVKPAASQGKALPATLGINTARVNARRAEQVVAGRSAASPA